MKTRRLIVVLIIFLLVAVLTSTLYATTVSETDYELVDQESVAFEPILIEDVPDFVDVTELEKRQVTSRLKDQENNLCELTFKHSNLIF